MTDSEQTGEYRQAPENTGAINMEQIARFQATLEEYKPKSDSDIHAAFENMCVNYIEGNPRPGGLIYQDRKTRQLVAKLYDIQDDKNWDPTNSATYILDTETGEITDSQDTGDVPNEVARQLIDEMLEADQPYLLKDEVDERIHAYEARGERVTALHAAIAAEILAISPGQEVDLKLESEWVAFDENSVPRVTIGKLVATVGPEGGLHVDSKDYPPAWAKVDFLARAATGNQKVQVGVVVEHTESNGKKDKTTAENMRVRMPDDSVRQVRKVSSKDGASYEVYDHKGQEWRAAEENEAWLVNYARLITGEQGDRDDYEFHKLVDNMFDLQNNETSQVKRTEINALVARRYSDSIVEMVRTERFMAANDALMRALEIPTNTQETLSNIALGIENGRGGRTNGRQAGEIIAVNSRKNKLTIKGTIELAGETHNIEYTASQNGQRETKTAIEEVTVTEETVPGRKGGILRGSKSPQTKRHTARKPIDPESPLGMCAERLLRRGKLDDGDIGAIKAEIEQEAEGIYVKPEGDNILVILPNNQRICLVNGSGRWTYRTETIKAEVQSLINQGVITSDNLNSDSYIQKSVDPAISAMLDQIHDSGFPVTDETVVQPILDGLDSDAEREVNYERGRHARAPRPSHYPRGGRRR